MPLLQSNGVVLEYEVKGAGEPVLLVMGTGADRRPWHLHQVPALVEAGYQAITFNNRGIPPSTGATEPYTVRDLAGDVAGLLEQLSPGPCRVVGFSLGAHVVQQLLMDRPELVSRAVLMGTTGRTDTLRRAMREAERLMYDRQVDLPPKQRAVTSALENLSRTTLADEAAVRDWLDIFEYAQPSGPGIRAQLDLELDRDHLAGCAAVTTPCHVIAFSDDVIAPPHLGREVAEAVPGCTFEEVAGCGHYGYLENPSAVNASLLKHLS
ncbi:MULTISPECIES: alpha/beta fold hydrolase [unclassified Streptomyces]|uniref:alpha/beta fold hydrolase n=1 Tax=unclassified Streptomyces TaxID=2593676 RepID=UPI0035DD61B9